MQDKRNTKGLMASFVLAIFVSAPGVAQMDDNQAMFDLVIQFQQLQDEVRMLRGMLEEQAMDLESLGNRQKDQYLDLDQRLTELRGLRPNSSIAGGTVATYGILNETGRGAPLLLEDAPQLQEGLPAVQAGLTQAREDLPDVRPALDGSSSVTAIATPDTQARAVVTSPEDEKATYDQAFQSLKDLKYADAAEQFLNFIEQYPNSDYTDNAQYWLGESYYVTRNYDIALEAFQDLLSNHPNSPKIADALLKIGYTHYELKQWDQARAALTQVQEQYPGTTLARLAGSRLRSLKLEGHY